MLRVPTTSRNYTAVSLKVCRVTVTKRHTRLTSELKVYRNTVVSVRVCKVRTSCTLTSRAIEFVRRSHASLFNAKVRGNRFFFSTTGSVARVLDRTVASSAETKATSRCIFVPIRCRWVP